MTPEIARERADHIVSLYIDEDYSLAEVPRLIVEALLQASREAREEAIRECADIAGCKHVFHSGHAGDWDHGASKTALDIKDEILSLLEKEIRFNTAGIDNSCQIPTCGCRLRVVVGRVGIPKRIGGCAYVDTLTSSTESLSKRSRNERRKSERNCEECATFSIGKR